MKVASTYIHVELSRAKDMYEIRILYLTGGGIIG